MTAKQPYRYRRVCARCHRNAIILARFPEGPICCNCLEAALRTRDLCPDCGTERALVGRRGDTPICRDCAGIERHFSCLRCGFEDETFGRLCARCKIAELLDTLLNDGSDTPSPALAPLATGLRETTNPTGTLAWLRKPHVRTLLTDLAAGRLDLTHQALAAHPHPMAARHLRGKLIDCGLLPAADKQLLDFEAWLHRRLATLTDHPHRRLLRQFGLWHQLAKMRAKAAARPLSPTASQYARQRFIQAQVFCTWIAEHNRKPAQLTQADLDTWYTTHRVHQRQGVRAFLTWAIERRHLPKLHLPRLTFKPGEAITQQRRLALLRRFVTSDHEPLRSRVAACLMLLYAQPISRILRLTHDDIEPRPGGQLLLRLGDPPAHVPEPFATLLLQLADSHDNPSTAANTTSRWLFPGRHPGQPLSYPTMHRHLTELGFPIRTARISALRQLVLQAPAPVIADALGFHYTTTQRQHTNAGATWSRYISNDHTPRDDQLKHPCDGDTMPNPTQRYRFKWKAEFSNHALNALHAEAFNHDILDHDWLTQVRTHSLGWVCAFDQHILIGFVYVPWDGAQHAFIIDPVVLKRYERQGVGTALLALATEHARAAGCKWLHVDFDEPLRRFYFDACGFTPTLAGLIDLTTPTTHDGNPRANGGQTPVPQP